MLEGNPEVVVPDFSNGAPASRIITIKMVVWTHLGAPCDAETHKIFLVTISPDGIMVTFCLSWKKA